MAGTTARPAIPSEQPRPKSEELGRRDLAHINGPPPAPFWIGIALLGAVLLAAIVWAFAR